MEAPSEPQILRRPVSEDRNTKDRLSCRELIQGAMDGNYPGDQRLEFILDRIEHQR